MTIPTPIRTLTQHERPEMGTWHTIKSIAKKTHKDNTVAWISEPYISFDARCGKYEWLGDKPKPNKIDFHDVQFNFYDKLTDGWKWTPANALTEIEGMYIGFRIKYNGVTDYDRYGGYPYFIHKSSVEVWMFVTKERQNPIPVFPFDIKLLEDKLS